MRQPYIFVLYMSVCLCGYNTRVDNVVTRVELTQIKYLGLKLAYRVFLFNRVLFASQITS